MTATLSPDLCVIGAGSGGLSVAAGAALLGVPVVLVEKGAMGGDCLNTGCVPSKALLAAAKRAHAIRTSGIFGIRASEPEVDFAAVMDHVHGVIRAIAPNDSVARFTGLGVQVIAGTARFRDRQTVEVGDVTIRARRFVIATGSRAAVPPIPGLADVPFLTNETVFENRIRPDHLIIIGAGPIGLEMAQAHRRLGARVTILEAARPLPKDDPEAAAVVLDALAREGVDIRSPVSIVRAERAGEGIRLVLADGGEITGSHLLVAAGRRPNIEDLGLEAAGIAFDARGVKVDEALRTTNRRVHAVGDVAGSLQFTHVANHHAGIVLRSALFRLPVRASAAPIPWVTYTDPELAHVGLLEAEVRRRHGTIRVLRWPFHENDRAQAERTVSGFAKIVTDRRGRILGATIVGAHAGELITPFTLAIRRKLGVAALADLVLPYPTLAEAGKRAAASYFSPRLTSPALRRMIRWLRAFG